METYRPVPGMRAMISELPCGDVAASIRHGPVAQVDMPNSGSGPDFRLSEACLLLPLLQRTA